METDDGRILMKMVGRLKIVLTPLKRALKGDLKTVVKKIAWVSIKGRIRYLKEYKAHSSRGRKMT